MNTFNAIILKLQHQIIAELTTAVSTGTEDTTLNAFNYSSNIDTISTAISAL